MSAGRELTKCSRERILRALVSARIAKSASVFHRLIGALLIVHVLLIGAMAASPQLHEFVHSDADHPDHECAVTLFASGSGASTTPVIFTAAFFAVLLAVTSCDARLATSCFLPCRILVRGPPVLA